MTRSKWLLVYNCQAIGLGNCLNLLSDRVSVEAYDVGTFQQHEEAVLGHLDEYERVLLMPTQPGSRIIELDRHPAIWEVPTILFHGYHPDLCYLAASGPLVGGPLHDYHSAIVYAAFQVGLDEAQAAALFRADVYERLGYFDTWDRERDAMLGHFAHFGFDMARDFVEWSRRGSFMHSCNHPRIHCLRSIARAILERAGHAPLDTAVLPHDNLANGPYFPVYPEVGARLGVRGDYGFKPGGSYQLMSLREFIAAYFELYRANPDVTASYPAYFPMIDKAIELVASIA